MIKQELPLKYGYNITCTRFVLSYTDIPAGTTPQSINLADAAGNAFMVPQGGIVLGFRLKNDTVFGGGAMAALTMTVGSQTTGGTGFFIGSGSAFNLMAAVADTTEEFALNFNAPTNATFGINVTITGDGATNFNTLTAGQMHIDVFVISFGPINTQAYPPSVTP